MKITFLTLVAICFLTISCNSPKEENTDVTADISSMVDTIDMVAKGEYLVNIGGCHHCHSPKMMTDKGPVLDPNKLLSGYPSDEVLGDYDPETAKQFVLFNSDLTAAIGPWGTSFSANLTPDDTGIGTWTDAQFLNAIRKGKLKGLDGSRGLLPPMPWQDIAKLTDADLKAIFAYLKSITPVANIVPAPVPPAGQ